MMKRNRKLATMALLATYVVSYAIAVPFLHSPTSTPSSVHASADTLKPSSDSLPTVKPRWRVQRTTPITYNDLDSSALDLRQPANLHYEVSYNDSLKRYVIGTKIGGTYLAAPVMMTPDERSEERRVGKECR